MADDRMALPDVVRKAAADGDTDGDQLRSGSASR
jgi:hypothetical protein